jgi:hypothetical protein
MPGLLERAQMREMERRQAQERALGVVIHQACDHYGLDKDAATGKWRTHRTVCIDEPQVCLAKEHPKAIIDRLRAERDRTLRLRSLTSRATRRLALIQQRQAPPFEVVAKVDPLVLYERNLRLRTPVYRDAIQEAVDEVTDLIRARVA